MVKNHLKFDSSELMNNFEKEISEKIYYVKEIKEQIKELGVLFDKVEY